MDNLIVVMMQRNEGALLALWIAFYKRLAPLTRLYVIDNGSDDDATREILSRHEARGLNVIRSFATAEDFARKGAVVQSVIEAAGLDGRFALPCDCDELLYVGAPDGPSIAPEAIARHFRGLARRDGAEVFRIGEQFYNMPNSDAGYRQLCKKLVFRNRIPIPLDSGYHYYSFNKKVSIHPGIGKTGLGYLHLHNKPFAQVQAGARRKLAASAMVEGRPRQSRHVLGYLDATEDDYLRSFADRPADVSIGTILASAGLASPFAVSS